ncbi:MAG: carboxypeptidase M32 [Candidatus Neomarinimicrobiota bacterium]|nr:MAG: carboxypeptidase M32 [Candidatus Neomarinimicrobiota bacterium]
MSALEALKAELRVVARLRSTASLLHWDQETHMPSGAGAARADQIALIESLTHERLVGDGVRRPLAELVDLDSGKPDPALDEETARLVHEIWRDYHQAAALPADFVEDYARLTARAQQVWAQSRKDNDFNAFAPYLEKIVAMKHREVEYLGKKETAYDTLLDQFEPGMTSAEVTRLFDSVKRRLVPLIQAIRDAGVDTRQEILKQSYPKDKQWQFGLQVLKDMGYDLDRGRQDVSAHPFTIDMHPTDVRITTRIDEHDFLSGFSSTVHEGGHGLYEQGLDPEWYGTPFGQAISYGIHESQSRLWENLVGLSKPFWRHYYPRLQALFPENLQTVDLDTFYRAINTVKPSLIRVDADEATYNLHIMLRFEIEKKVINDGLPVRELPELWNRKMEEYLGVRPDSDANGVLQDVHWSFGGFGYFPTYALGNLYNVPIMNQARKEIEDLEEKIASGNLLELREWLRNRLHRLGRRKTASELIQDLTGSPLSAEPFMEYLETKYREIYGI